MLSISYFYHSVYLFRFSCFSHLSHLFLLLLQHTMTDIITADLSIGSQPFLSICSVTLEHYFVVIFFLFCYLDINIKFRFHMSVWHRVWETSGAPSKGYSCADAIIFAFRNSCFCANIVGILIMRSFIYTRDHISLSFYIEHIMNLSYIYCIIWVSHMRIR